MRRNRLVGSLAVWLLCPAAVATGAQDFHVSLAPDTVFAEVDSLFTVSLFAEATAVQFNAYDVTIEFDSTMVEYISVAAGPLMTGACGNAFFFPEVAPTSITLHHSLLGEGCLANGPGVLSEFTFRAKADGTSLLDTTADDPDSCHMQQGFTLFFDAGYCVNLHPTLPRTVIVSDAVVLIGDQSVGAEDITPIAGPSPLRFHPNPARKGGEFHFSLRSPAPARLDVFDPAGRRVFSRSWPAAGSGLRRVPWRGTNGGGVPLAAGIYFARLEHGSLTETTKIVLIR